MPPGEARSDIGQRGLQRGYGAGRVGLRQRRLFRDLAKGIVMGKAGIGLLGGGEGFHAIDQQDGDERQAEGEKIDMFVHGGLP